MTIVTLEQAQKDLEELFYIHFPNGWFKVKKQCLGSGYNYYFGLLGENGEPDLTVASNRIAMNDIGYNSGMISADGGFYDIDGERYKFIINPADKFHALDYAEVTVRRSKTKGYDWNKVLAVMKARFKKYHKLVQDNKGNVYQDHRDNYDLKYFG